MNEPDRALRSLDAIPGPVDLAVAGRTLYVADHGDGTVTALKIG